jgi:hypothetical protein
LPPAGEGSKQALREDPACLTRLWPRLRFPVEFKAVTWAYRSPGLDLRTGQVPPHVRTVRTSPGPRCRSRTVSRWAAGHRAHPLGHDQVKLEVCKASWSNRKLVGTARRYRTIEIQADPHTITVAGAPPEDLRGALDRIHSAPVRTNLSQVRLEGS